jgi:hypothetical protein
MTGVEQVVLQIRQVSLVRLCPRHRENLVVLAPCDQRRGLIFPKVLLPVLMNVNTLTYSD